MPHRREHLVVAPEIAKALAADNPVVALESTVVAHGLPRPDNLETARALESAVRGEGALPATVAVLDGRLKVGLDADELKRIAEIDEVAKLSSRDLAACIARGRAGATTVAATLVAAAAAGIRVFATGGIGGVHPGGQDSLDMSADLIELARRPVAVVCAGAKSLLDLPRTLEVLETQGVPLIGFCCDRLPAFYQRATDLPLPARADSPNELAAICEAHWSLGGAGLVICNPIDEAEAIAAEALAHWQAQAALDAAAAGIAGPALTPFLLRRLNELSDGGTLAANRALLEGNARLAAGLAVALSHLWRRSRE